MHRTLLSACMISAGLIQSLPAQSPITMTESASTLGKGKIHAGAGAEYLTRSVAPGEDIPSSLFRVLVGSVHQGVAENVNFDLLWKGFLVAQYRDRPGMSDWGDLSIWTKINFFPETPSWPAVALRTGIKLPNTRYTPTKLGNNQTDYHSQVLVSKWLGSTELRTAAGFSIVGDPLTAASQDDVYSLQVAAMIEVFEGDVVFVELAGRTGYQSHDDKLVGRTGFVGNTSLLKWSVFGLVRLVGSHRDFASAFDCSEAWSVGIFFTKEFHIDL